MARKELFYTISGTKGRDEGKVFYIQEMTSSQGEWWAVRAFIGMSKSGFEVPDNLKDMGLVGLATFGFSLLSKMNPEDAKPLMEELMSCIQYVPDPGNKKVARPLIESDIEEVATRLKLKAETLKLHVDFFFADAA